MISTDYDSVLKDRADTSYTSAQPCCLFRPPTGNLKRMTVRYVFNPASTFPQYSPPVKPFIFSLAYSILDTHSAASQTTNFKNFFPPIAKLPVIQNPTLILNKNMNCNT